MIDSSSMRPRNRCTHIISIPILAISILLAAIFMASCGDEGDTTEDPTGMMPETQPAAQPEDPVVIEEPVVVEEEPKVSFKDHIQPILAERCALAGCHAAPGAAGLDLSKYDTFKKGGNTGPAFAAGDGDGSLVVKRIDGGGMPPGGPPLDGDQIQLFIDWIDEGAENN